MLLLSIDTVGGGYDGPGQSFQVPSGRTSDAQCKLGAEMQLLNKGPCFYAYA